MTNDQMILDLIKEHKALELKSHKLEAAERAARETLPTEYQSGIPFPKHLDFFFPDSKAWRVAMDGDFLTRQIVESFNAQVLKWATPSTPEQVEKSKNVIPTVDWVSVYRDHDERCETYAPQAAAAQQRLDWIAEHERQAEQERERAGLRSLEKENDGIIEEMFAIEDTLQTITPDTLKGAQALAQFVSSRIKETDEEDSSTARLALCLANAVAKMEPAHA